MAVFYLDGFALSFLVKTKKGSQARLVPVRRWPWIAMDIMNKNDNNQRITYRVTFYLPYKDATVQKLLNHYISDPKIFIIFNFRLTALNKSNVSHFILYLHCEHH